jgi:phosphoglycerate-specific signal transduction histidine kinase
MIRSLLDDRLDLLDELRSIAAALDWLEQQHGPREEITDVRQKLHAVRARVLGQAQRAQRDDTRRERLARIRADYP